MKARTNINLTAAFLTALLFAPPTFAQNALSLTATSTAEATIITTIAAAEVRVRQASPPFVAYYVTDSAATPGRVRIEPGASYSFFGSNGGGYNSGATVGSIRLVAGAPIAFEVVQLPKSTSGVTSFNTRTGAVTTQASDIPDNAANTSGNAATATALASTPSQCTGVNFSQGIAASGNANCAQPSNVTGTAANLAGTPALPNGTTATTQSQADGSTKLATTAYVDTGLSTKAIKICSQVAIVMPTSAISSAAESSTATGTCTGLTTSDSIICTSSVHITGVTGFVPSASGILTITTWPTTNTINASYVNNTGGSITPGALTINCGAVK